LNNFVWQTASSKIFPGQKSIFVNKINYNSEVVAFFGRRFNATEAELIFHNLSSSSQSA
jgi:hypothetical protein